MTLLPHGQRHIAVLAFDGVQSLDVVGPMEVFAAANFHSPSTVKPYRTTLTSLIGDDIPTNAGLRLGGAIDIKDLPVSIDTLVIAGGSAGALRAAAADDWLRSWLLERAQRTRRMASVCVGAFVLCASGLLDGRRATTHWNSCDLLQALFPRVSVEPNTIFVADPPFYTSAGVTAAIDLSLAFVEADCGPAVAVAVARSLVLYLRRPGGQSQFSIGLKIQADAAPRIRTMLEAIMQDPTGDLSGPELAKLAGMSERTFSRVFHRETGHAPARFVELLRVDRAKTLLETSDWPLARVADRSGFGSIDALHRAFLKHAGVSPGFYRDRFSGVAIQ